MKRQGKSANFVLLFPNKNLLSEVKTSFLKSWIDNCKSFNGGDIKHFDILGKIVSRRHIEIFFLFFPENRIWHFMQIVSIGDNLHEMSNSVSRKNNKNINLLSAELAQRAVMCLRGLGILGRFSAIFTRQTTFDFCLLSCKQYPFWKKVNSKRVDLYSEGAKTVLKALPSLKMYQFPINTLIYFDAATCIRPVNSIEFLKWSKKRKYCNNP